MKLKCICSQNSKLKTVDNRQSQEFLRRRYVCLSCGRRFASLEFFVLSTTTGFDPRKTKLVLQDAKEIIRKRIKLTPELTMIQDFEEEEAAKKSPSAKKRPRFNPWSI